MAEDFDMRQNSQMYESFLKLIGYSIVGIVGLLVFLALFVL